MENLVTVKTFTYPHEVAIIRGRLESEGIECFVQDEFTIQINNFYSNALGGIKLQVREHDVPAAIEILKEGGYLTDEDFKPTAFSLKVEKLVEIISKSGKRIILIVVAIFFIGLILYYATVPGLNDSLTQYSWCLDYLTYQGKDYQPNTTGFRIEGFNSCPDVVMFRSDYKIIFPGFNSYTIYGKWSLTDKKLTVQNTDTFQNVFNGIYDVALKEGQLILTSATTTIYCYQQNRQ